MEFRLFCRRGLIFALPLLLWIVTIALVDPFDYFNWQHLIPEQAKKDNAASLNSILFNMLKERHNPCENLIIGDSRAEDLPLDYIEKITGEKYFILGANALKLNESIDLFYFANRLKPIKHAVFTINFNQFNEFAFADRVTSVEAMIHNPLNYFFDSNVAEAGYHVVHATLTGHPSIDSTPPMSRDEWWNYIVTIRGREHYGRFKYPSALYKRMQEMVAFAKAQNTQVTFIVVPNHADLQKRVREFGLDKEYLQFKRDLSQLSVRVVDFDYLNEITTNKSDFRDPLHSNEEIGRLISNEVFVGPLAKGKLLDATWAQQCSEYLF
jgi:hypothetical protein